MHAAAPTITCPTCAGEIALPATGEWLTAELFCTACGWKPPRQDGFALLAPALAAMGSDYDPAGFEQLAAAEAWHFWFAPRARLLAGLIDHHFATGTNFLEIGCGTGYVTGVIAGRRQWQRIMGGEVSADGLAHAKRLLPAQVELMQMDARDMPFRAAFDVIGCFDVLEHITEDELVLAGFARALRPGGGVVLSVPQHMWLWSPADAYAQHKRRYARNELEEKCRAAGLEVVASMSYASVTLPLMLASRFATRNVSVSEGAPEELKPPRWVNSILRAALQAEVSLSLAGLHWPVGGSRVVVARRPGA